MINHIIGKLLVFDKNYIALENHGVGYGIHIDSKTFAEIKELPEMMLLVHEKITESERTLYGFINENERQLFKQLIKLPKIGCSTAITIMSGLTEQEILKGITDKDVKLFGAIKGIGPKTAKTIVEDFKL